MSLIKMVKILQSFPTKPKPDLNFMLTTQTQTQAELLQCPWVAPSTDTWTGEL